MADDIPSIVHHVSLGTNHFERATGFYDRVLPLVGARKVMSLPGAAAYGKQFPEFWIQTPFDREAAATGNGTHVAFIASSREAVDAFHAAALEAGAYATALSGSGPTVIAFGPRDRNLSVASSMADACLDSGHSCETYVVSAAVEGAHPTENWRTRTRPADL